MPSTGDSALVGRQEVTSQGEGITNAHAKLDVQLASEGQMEESGVRDAARHATPLRADVWQGKVGKQIVEPLVRRSDGK